MNHPASRRLLRRITAAAAALLLCLSCAGCGIIRNLIPFKKAETQPTPTPQTANAQPAAPAETQDASTPEPTDASDSSKTENTKAPDRRQQYRDFFYTNFRDDSLVCFADVTGDRLEEMLVVSFDNNEGVYGDVLSVVDGTVRPIYHKEGAKVHAGGFFNWYLLPLSDGTSRLVEESGNMWQGVGQLSWVEYTLTATGARQVTAEKVLDTDDPGMSDASGFVTDEALSDYTDSLSAELAKCKTLYSAFSEAASVPPSCMHAPGEVF